MPESPAPPGTSGRAIRPALPSDLDAVRHCVLQAYALYVPRMGREPAPMTADYAALGRLEVEDSQGRRAWTNPLWMR